MDLSSLYPCHPMTLTPPAPELVAIYGLADPRIHAEARRNGIRYVGKANDPERRLAEHVCAKDMSRRTNWIRSLIRAGVQPSIIILAWVVPDEWQVAERHYIALLQRVGCDLVNGSCGGLGGTLKGRTTSLRGRKCAPDVVARRRATRLANGGWQVSDESRAKMSASHKGKPLSPTHRLGLKNKPPISDETRHRLSEAGKRRGPVSDDVRKRTAESISRVWAERTPEERAEISRKISKTERGRSISPQTIAAVAQANRGKKRTPEQRANIAAGIHKAQAERRQLGIPLVSDAARQRMSEAQSNRPDRIAQREKKVISPEEKAERRLQGIARGAEARRGQQRSAETRARMSAAQRGREITEETKEKLRAAAIKQFSDPAARERAAEKSRGQVHSAEHKENIGKALRGRPRSTEAIAKTAEKKRGQHLTEEQRKHVSDGLKRRYAKDREEL